MYYNTKRNILYLCHARTASSYTGQVLQLHGFEPTRNHHGTIDEARIYHPINSNTMIFTTVRNHFSLLASWFITTHGKRFDIDWVEKMLGDDMHFKLDMWMLGSNPVYKAFYHNAHFVLKFEHLERQMQVLGFNDFKFKPPLYDYKVLYGIPLREFVTDLFRYELEKFGYTFDNGVEYGI